MRMLAEFFPEFTGILARLDEECARKRPFDQKTDELFRFALAIKGRSKPCLLKHLRGALEAGAGPEEVSYVVALVMREAAGVDDCWVHDIIGDLEEIQDGMRDCSCPE